jgi:hypothetical protein
MNRTISVLPAYGASGPVVINGNQVLAWVLGIIAWVCICSGAWFVATRADYVKLAEANICYGSDGHSHSTLLQCANVKPSDAAFYKSEIDRKARISRLAAAAGGLVAAITIIVIQSQKRRRRYVRIPTFRTPSRFSETVFERNQQREAEINDSLKQEHARREAAVKNMYRLRALRMARGEKLTNGPRRIAANIAKLPELLRRR